MADLKIMDLVELLLQNAAKSFPSLTITHEISTLPDRTVIRLIHHKAINNEHSWTAIVSLTELWQSEKRAKVVKPTSFGWIMTEYNDLIFQAVELGLLNLKEFQSAT